MASLLERMNALRAAPAAPAPAPTPAPPPPVAVAAPAAPVLPPDAPASKPELASKAPEAPAAVEAPPPAPKRGPGRPPGSPNKPKTAEVVSVPSAPVAPSMTVIEVTLSHGMTINLGDYNSARVDVTMRAALSGGMDEKAAREALHAKVIEALDAEASEYLKHAKVK